PSTLPDATSTKEIAPDCLVVAGVTAVVGGPAEPVGELVAVSLLPQPAANVDATSTINNARTRRVLIGDPPLPPLLPVLVNVPSRESVPVTHRPLSDGAGRPRGPVPRRSIHRRAKLSRSGRGRRASGVREACDE